MDAGKKTKAKRMKRGSVRVHLCAEWRLRCSSISCSRLTRSTRSVGWSRTYTHREIVPLWLSRTIRSNLGNTVNACNVIRLIKVWCLISSRLTVFGCNLDFRAVRFCWNRNTYMKMCVNWMRSRRACRRLPCQRWNCNSCRRRTRRRREKTRNSEKMRKAYTDEGELWHRKCEKLESWKLILLPTWTDSDAMM